jgi:hypothetical protein
VAPYRPDVGATLRHHGEAIHIGLPLGIRYYESSRIMSS